MKLNFRLEVDDGWPPVSSESLWVESVGELFRIRNSPFFVKGIAYDDVVRVIAFNETEVALEQVVEMSGNSTIWLYFRNPEIENQVLADIKSLGCGFEGGALKGYFSVNVPKSVNIDKVVAIVSPFESRGELSVAYPADRH